MPLLEVEAVDTYYGRVHALQGVSLSIEEGEIVTLIGSNGAGKTTTLRTISGLTPASKGQVRLRGRDITRLPPDEIVGLGIGHVPEGRRIFHRMSVRDNLILGAYQRKDREGIRRDQEHVLTLFPRVRQRLNQIGGTLSGGEQQMLAIARGLMSKPKVLLLEQNATKALTVSNRGYVLETGRIVKQGPTKMLLESPDVQRAYLGI